ncbi:helix-turn-helix transcriptional regulator [Deinococcus peraridilitoris]|uniref:Helix-turn-helix protein n=1 Tax=Deinococcus peraridilitoris (strain DSM 19664 / LMG 22246 / CIP 109416 / KR-200) TaxID=937777 RepID=L0A6E7_DEIPD|nr:helix-turn-helix transcriptional regulator [Deinococcus peraridilitoris]AFZ69421.1 Helix-turn-helix protein [Deinococcus peraridilitoris DSM 19664]
MDAEAIRATLREHIKNRGYGGQAELARQLGLSRTYLNHVLTGRSPLPLDLLDRIAEALGFELELREKQPTS